MESKPESRSVSPIPQLPPKQPQIRDYSSEVKVSHALSQTFDPKVIKKEEVNLGKIDELDKGEIPQLAFVLRNVFTKDECKSLIDISEAKGFEPAYLNVGGGREVLAPSIRNSTRTIIDDEDFAAILWSRIQSFIPTTFKGHKAIGVNERLRILRYDPGQKFEQHFDGAFRRPGTNEISKITLQIYLNEKCKGGATTFIGSIKNLPVQPKTGSILVFEHKILHEGSEVKSGRKYTIRTEVMYGPE